MQPISPSQIKLVGNCERAYSMRHVLRLPLEAGQVEDRLSADFGEAVHTIAENWNEHAQAPDNETEAGKAFSMMMRFAPRPRTGQSEGWITFRLGAFAFRGRVDWRGLAGDLADNTPDDTRACVLDYKTSTDPEEYGLSTIEDFLSDPQAVLYGLHTAESRDVSEVVLRWLYGHVAKRYRKSGKVIVAKDVLPRTVLLSRDALRQAYVTRIHPRVERIIQLHECVKSVEDALRLPQAPVIDGRTHCDAFGGCPRRSTCFPSIITGKDLQMGTQALLDLGLPMQPPAPQAAPVPQAAAPVPQLPTAAPQVAPQLQVPQMQVPQMQVPQMQVPQTPGFVGVNQPLVHPVTGATPAQSSVQVPAQAFAPPAATQLQLPFSAPAEPARSVPVVEIVTAPKPSAEMPAGPSETEIAFAVRTLLRLFRGA